MKKIKINFADMWGDTDPENNRITRLLRKKYNVEICDNPDYLIYSCFGNKHLKYDCIRIFITGENVIPDFNLCDYALGYSKISFEDRYIRFPVFILSDKSFNKAINKHKIDQSILNSKTEFCNFIYSNNSKADPYRKAFFDRLTVEKHVDSGGRYLNNIGYRVKDKIEFQSKYKFSIAIENSQLNGYTTEKIIDAFASQTIPIYWGNPLITEDFNVNSFINCHDYPSIDAIIEQINKIDSDDTLYLKMLSEPIFPHNKIPYEFTEDYLLDFFDRIFDQSLDEALRRTKYGWNYKYERDLKKMIKYKRLQYVLSRLSLDKIRRKMKI